MSSDNWAHRSKGIACGTCMWFVPKRVGEQPTEIGRCRRRAPTLNGWPAVFDSDWCGDHKLDENRLPCASLGADDLAKILDPTVVPRPMGVIRGSPAFRLTNEELDHLRRPEAQTPAAYPGVAGPGGAHPEKIR